MLRIDLSNNPLLSFCFLKLAHLLSFCFALVLSWAYHYPIQLIPSAVLRMGYHSFWFFSLSKIILFVVFHFPQSYIFPLAMAKHWREEHVFIYILSFFWGLSLPSKQRWALAFVEKPSPEMPFHCHTQSTSGEMDEVLSERVKAKLPSIPEINVVPGGRGFYGKRILKT